MTLTQLFAQLEHAIAEHITDHAVEHIPGYRELHIPKDVLVARIFQSVHAFGRDLDEAQPHYYREHLEHGAYQRATENLAIDAFEQIVLIGYIELVSTLKQHLAADLPQQIAMIEKCSVIGQTGLAGVYTGYTQARNATIDHQQAEIRELATPLIPLADNVVAMPLIGTIDARRSQQVLETLLGGIVKHQAAYAILDITGVKMVDTQVAQGLLRVAQAAKLLGAQVILTGLGAEIAQTLVTLGADLSGIITLANVQAGIAYALRLHGLAIQPLTDV